MGGNVPLRFEQPANGKEKQTRDHIGISDLEIVQMVAAYRNFGFWRIEVESGHFFASEDVFAIFCMTFTSGPANLVELLSRIQPEDRVLITETFEQASLHKTGFHFSYRVDNGLGGYKTVRSVGKFRNNEIVGITYEFVEQLRVVGFEDNGA
jgi:hypothetical protein